jgi:hypothetical protein
MVIKEFTPDQSAGQPVKSGDSLYFFRDNAERDLRVTASEILKYIHYVSFVGCLRTQILIRCIYTTWIKRNETERRKYVRK